MTCLKNESVLYLENEGSVTQLGLDQENHRTKHVQTQHFFVGELDSGTKTVVDHIPAEFHFADCMKSQDYNLYSTLWV